MGYRARLQRFESIVHFNQQLPLCSPLHNIKPARAVFLPLSSAIPSLKSLQSTTTLVTSIACFLPRGLLLTSRKRHPALPTTRHVLRVKRKSKPTCARAEKVAWPQICPSVQDLTDVYLVLQVLFPIRSALSPFKCSPGRFQLLPPRRWRTRRSCRDSCLAAWSTTGYGQVSICKAWKYFFC